MQPAAALVHMSTSAQSMAHCVCVSYSISVSHTSPTSFSISYKSKNLLRDLMSTCAGSTKCTCIQRVQMTLNFIVVFEHMCSTRSTSDSMCEGIGTSLMGTN
jgi:hypothetical protein